MEKKKTTDLGLRLSNRPNIVFVHCRYCHRPHLASQTKIFCPKQTTTDINTTVNPVAVPFAFTFLSPKTPFCFRVSSFSSLVDRPPTPFRYDTDEESLEDEERHWVITPLPLSPKQNDITLVSSEELQTVKPSSSYRKWIVSFQPWTQVDRL